MQPITRIDSQFAQTSSPVANAARAYRVAEFICAVAEGEGARRAAAAKQIQRRTSDVHPDAARTAL